jgi:hypothetical protein
MTVGQRNCFMGDYSIKEVAQALGWRPSRIEKMISRDNFVPERAHSGGRHGRTWSFTDVLKLQLISEIPGTAAERKRVIDQVYFGAVTDDQFVVIAYWSGPERIVKTPLLGGGMLTERRPPPPSAEVLYGEEILKLARNQWLTRLVVISLANLHQRVRSALEALRPPQKQAARRPVLSIKKA